MDENLRFATGKLLERVKAALDKNFMETRIVQTAAEVADVVKGMVAPGASVACGGSVTLAETGVLALLNSGDYNFLDRNAPGVDRAAVEFAGLSADVYFASANAVTQDGEIYNVDGHRNRVASIVYGPKRVIIVAGVNKVVADLAAARRRVAEVTAPANCKRLGLQTACATKGVCEPGAGCICCAEMVLRAQSEPERVKVILVNEPLGY